MTTSFKDQYSFEERLKESTRIKSKYPDRIPIIVEISNPKFSLFSKQEDLKPLEKKKYLVPNNLSIGEFQHIIRQKLKVDQTKAIFLFVNNTIPPTSELLSVIHDKFHDIDGFTYCFLSFESTFGDDFIT